MDKRRAIFIDTSVLDNLLEIPQKSQDSERAQEDFLEFQQDSSVQFVLPATAVIETGNHIAQIKSGKVRRSVAEKFGDMLKMVCDSHAPWVLHDFEWGEDFLRDFLAGDGTGVVWAELAQARVGGGDLSILVEAATYEDRLKIRSLIWTYDAGLRSYASNLAK